MIVKKTCIVCPKGCELSIEEVDSKNETLKVSGNGCKRGVEFAQSEMYHPMRTLQTTVGTTFEDFERLPVKTSDVIPKGKMFDVMKVTKEITIDYKVNTGDIIVENVLGLNVDIVATATIRI